MQKYRSPRSFSVSSPAACEPRHTPVPTSHGLGTGQGRGLGPRGHTTRSTSGDASAFSLSLLSAVAGPATPTGAANGGTRRRAETSTPRRRCGVGFTRTKKKIASAQLATESTRITSPSPATPMLQYGARELEREGHVRAPSLLGPRRRRRQRRPPRLHHGPPFLQARHSSAPRAVVVSSQSKQHLETNAVTRRAGGGVRRPPRHVSVALRPRASTAAAGGGDWGTSRWQPMPAAAATIPRG